MGKISKVGCTKMKPAADDIKISTKRRRVETNSSDDSASKERKRRSHGKPRSQSRKHGGKRICARGQEQQLQQPKITVDEDHIVKHNDDWVLNDVQGHLIYDKGDVIQGRYEILGTLGEGTFGKVIKVKHLPTNELMALKVIRCVSKYKDAAKMEIKVLEKIASMDPTGKYHCVKMFNWFEFCGHMCLTFEILGPSVYDVLQLNSYQPYPMHHIQHIAYQLCCAVKFLHDKKLTHTDLKPENILFVDSSYEMFRDPDTKRDIKIMKRTDIKVIDFGNATFDNDHHSRIVATRHYRAPEIILELGWYQPCDVWAIACILFEMYSGETLFQTHQSFEHLAMMETVLGQIPEEITSRSKTNYYRDGKLQWRSDKGSYVKKYCKRLIKHKRSNDEDDENLFILIAQMMEYEPVDRMTLGKALEHPFFHKIRCSR